MNLNDRLADFEMRDPFSVLTNVREKLRSSLTSGYMKVQETLMT